jgi:hypothetical protein
MTRMQVMTQNFDLPIVFGTCLMYGSEGRSVRVLTIVLAAIYIMGVARLWPIVRDCLGGRIATTHSRRGSAQVEVDIVVVIVIIIILVIVRTLGSGALSNLSGSSRGRFWGSPTRRRSRCWLGRLVIVVAGGMSVLWRP